MKFAKSVEILMTPPIQKLFLKLTFAKAVASPITEKLKPVCYSAKQTTMCLLTYIDRE